MERKREINLTLHQKNTMTTQTGHSPTRGASLGSGGGRYRGGRGGGGAEEDDGPPPTDSLMDMDRAGGAGGRGR